MDRNKNSVILEVDLFFANLYEAVIGKVANGYEWSFDGYKNNDAFSRDFNGDRFVTFEQAIDFLSEHTG